MVKTDSVGNMLWSKTYGGVSGDSVVQTSDGGFAIAGMTLPVGANGNEVYLVKTDSVGNMLWSKTYGGTGTDEGYSVVQTSDGGFAIAGMTLPVGANGNDVYLVKTDSVGNMLWSKTYGGGQGRSVVQTSDGGFAIAGFTDAYKGGVCLVKTDSVGNMLWNKTYGGISGDSVVQTSDGGYRNSWYLFFWASSRLYGEYLVKTDSTGNMLWNKTYERPSSTFGGSLVQTEDGGFAYGLQSTR